MQSAAMLARREATRMIPRERSAFALFGGYIVGRQIELVPTELIVQAWRVRIDHTGFPNGQAEHLASGWHEHYSDPLAKFLSSP